MSRPSILFACRANAGRSVAAKLLAEHYAGGRVAVHSAGSEPGERVHPEVATVLAERGLDASQERPAPFDPDGVYDVVVTMAAATPARSTAARGTRTGRSTIRRDRTCSPCAGSLTRSTCGFVRFLRTSLANDLVVDKEMPAG